MNTSDSTRTLVYWEDKLQALRNRISILHMHLRSNELQFKKIATQKLKKLSGHGLNEEYTGYKIHRRREAWLKNRLTKLTIIAAHKREFARLKATKLPFYIKKIESLGGVVDKTRDWI